MTYTKGGINAPEYIFTVAQLDIMRERYEAGATFTAIAQAMGLPTSAHRTVSRRCKQLPDASHGKRARAGRPVIGA